MLVIVLLPVAVWLGRSVIEQAMLIAVSLLVLVVELLNSAVEAAIDRIGPEQHVFSGRAKDMGSAAVFVVIAIVFGVCAAVALGRFP